MSPPKPNIQTPSRHGVPVPESLAQTASKLRETGLIHRLLELAYDEDLGSWGTNPPHDWTGELMFARDQVSTARLVSRESGIAAGLAFVPDIIAVFVEQDEPMDWAPVLFDGESMKPGDTLGTLTGSSIALVRLERTLLNLVARLSGIATRTSRFVGLVEGTDAKVCDTRKTTPGHRVLEKYAVRCGGGVSHRMGLHDALLIKDNHLAGLGEPEFKDRIIAASSRAREQNLGFVQVEVDTLEQLGWVLSCERGTCDIVLLDNMDPVTLARAVTMRDESNPSLLLEASGGINEQSIRAIAQTGIDRISIGGLTHQAVSLDIGLDTQ